MELSAGVSITPTLRLVRLLGRGGMGSVWVADHLGLDTEVAVKFISPDLAGSDAMLARFRREAKATAQIKSPHVVRVFDQGVTEDGTAFIVMELLEGESLAARIERCGRLRMREVARVLGEVGRALGAAHRLGIVHRDIKPENIFLARAGDEPDALPIAKVLDFGIAKSEAAIATGGLTATGVGVGTPEYMSPEQMTDTKNVGPASDLWALGAVAYRALTGQPPYSAPTLVGLWQAKSRGERPSAHELVPELPAAIDAWFARALALEPADRFDSAKGMIAELERIAAQSPAEHELPEAAPAEGARATTELDAVPTDLLQPRSTEAADTQAFVAESALAIHPEPPAAPSRSPVRPAATELAPAATATQAEASATISQREPRSVARFAPMALGAALLAGALWLAFGLPAGSAPTTQAPAGSSSAFLVASSGSSAEPGADAPPPGGGAGAPGHDASPTDGGVRVIRGYCTDPSKCVAPQRAWCDQAGRFLACCPAGLVAVGADGMCACPPGGTSDSNAAKAGCTTSAPPAAGADAIRTVVRAHFPDLNRCYEAARARNEQTAGKVTLYFELSPDGDVFSARIADTEVGDVEFQRCLLGVVRSLRFAPPFGGGMTTIKYPVTFTRDP